MKFYRYRHFCLCPMGGQLPGGGALGVEEPFSPLVFLVEQDPARSRGIYAVESLSDLDLPQGAGLLLPNPVKQAPSALSALVERDGATVLNTAFKRAYTQLLAMDKKRAPFTLSLVGLGDVGGFTLTALRLLGGNSIERIQIYDPNAAQCSRYGLELNQVLLEEGPRIEITDMDGLFDCDAFLFTASRGVPPVGSEGQDVRMVQYEGNRSMVAAYAQMARQKGFSGLFAQISDPVDQLSRAAFLAGSGPDFDGLLPEQIQGYGLGVMQARANYYARKRGLERAYAFGPHGRGLVVANELEDGYDEALSLALTKETLEANLRVRELGFKPFIAPALSSAALSILRTLRGEWHEGAVPLGGAYFGCRSRFGKNGLLLERKPLAPGLHARILQSYTELEAFSYDG